jgi:hypothetical protein
MSDPTNLPPEPSDETADDSLEKKQRLLDRFRGTGVGVEDPNLGDADDATTGPPGVDDDGEPAAP